jgi:phage terminase large subunit-like protein
VERLVLEVAQSDGYATTIFIPQDPAQPGAAQVANFTRLLMGYPLASERANGDKRTRAMAVAAQCNIGNVGMVKAAWNPA